MIGWELSTMYEQNDMNKRDEEQNIDISEKEIKRERILFITIIMIVIAAIVFILFFDILISFLDPYPSNSDIPLFLSILGYKTGAYYAPCLLYFIYICAIYGIVGPKPRLRKIYYIGITLFGVMGIGYIIWDLPYLLATYPPQVAPGAFDETTAIFSQLFAFFSVHGILSGIYRLPPYLPKECTEYRAVFAEEYAQKRTRPEIRWLERYFIAYFGLPDATEKEEPKALQKQNRWSWKDEEGRKNVVTLVMLIGIIAMWAFGIHNVQIGWEVYTGLTIISAMVMILLRVRKKQQTPENKNIDI